MAAIKHPRAHGSALALIAFIVAALGPGPAWAQQPVPPDVMAASACDVASAPAKCRACLRQAKAPTPADRQMAQPLCGVCASLPTTELQDFCASCLAAHGTDSGCSLCASNAIGNVMMRGGRVKWVAPRPDELKAAASCFACNMKAKPEVQASPACYACWIPRPENGSRSAAMRGACSACAAAAPTASDAGMCSICSSQGIYATEAQCYACQAAAKSWGAKALCGLSPRPDEKRGKKAAALAPGPAPLLQEYFSCLAAAGSDDAAQLCTLCLPSTSKLGDKRGRECFACMQGAVKAELSRAKVLERGYACVRP